MQTEVREIRGPMLYFVRAGPDANTLAGLIELTWSGLFMSNDINGTQLMVNSRAITESLIELKTIFVYVQLMFN